MIKNPKVGDRVAWRCPYVFLKDRGTVTGFGKNNQIRVRWDSDGGEQTTYPENCRRLVKKKRALKLKPGQVVVSRDDIIRAMDSLRPSVFDGVGNALLNYFCDALGMERV